MTRKRKRLEYLLTSLMMKKQCNPGVGGKDDPHIDVESEVLQLDGCLADEATDAAVDPQNLRFFI